MVLDAWVAADTHTVSDAAEGKENVQSIYSSVGVSNLSGQLEMAQKDPGSRFPGMLLGVYN